MAYITKTVFLLKTGDNYYTDKPWDTLWSVDRDQAREFISVSEIENSIHSRSIDGYKLTEGEFDIQTKITIIEINND